MLGSQYPVFSHCSWWCPAWACFWSPEDNMTWDWFRFIPTGFPAIWNCCEEEMAGAKSCAVKKSSLSIAVTVTIFQKGPFALELVNICQKHEPEHLGWCVNCAIPSPHPFLPIGMWWRRRGGSQSLFLALWPSGGEALHSHSPYMCHQLQYFAGCHFRGGANGGEEECQMKLIIWNLLLYIWKRLQWGGFIKVSLLVIFGRQICRRSIWVERQDINVSDQWTVLGLHSPLANLLRQP